MESSDELFLFISQHTHIHMPFSFSNWTGSQLYKQEIVNCACVCVCDWNINVQGWLETDKCHLCHLSCDWMSFGLLTESFLLFFLSCLIYISSAADLNIKNMSILSQEPVTPWLHWIGSFPNPNVHLCVCALLGIVVDNAFWLAELKLAGCRKDLNAISSNNKRQQRLEDGFMVKKIVPYIFYFKELIIVCSRPS